ncbi:hypothetical protein BZB76_4743 [Actinomadura pelletieri DSM 43383]|uniref:Mce-associated membrane protein n=1 Tax=Actinomadura pelletieri DSM 43383 TaxID=1120940 RepID=A0A495QIE6_9ACTN|nr:hypothetical protein [Actinomadura pelletieri]RKS71932.1 hypothetical protein BZB76_4743 [Actinomadura pelletieri DSM 43383]
MRDRLVRPPAPGAVLTLCLLTGGLLTGCGSSGSSSGGQLAPNGTLSDAPAAAPAAAPPSAIPPKQLYQTVLNRYRAYQAAYQKAYETNDPTDLPTVAMDPILGQVTRDVQATKAKGEIWRFTNTLNPRVYARAKDSTKVYVIDCVRTLAAFRFSAKTGRRLDGGPGSAYVYRATVQYDSGVWKVAATVRDKPC